MAARRLSSLLIVVGCTLPLAGSGCNGRTSSSDAADAPARPTSTDGAASGGTLGTGGGSAGGSGGMAGIGGTTGAGGKRDGGNVDYPVTVSSGGVSGLDAALDGGTELHCVGTPSNLYCPAGESECYRVPGCFMQVPTTGHCNYGTARACSSNTTPTSCAAESGCVWSVDGGSSNGCGGTATACSYDMSRDKCEAAGCQYLINGQYCTGTPTPCTQISFADCTSQPGCALGIP